MEKVFGILRFADGETRFLLFNGSGSTARPALFSTVQMAYSATDDQVIQELASEFRESAVASMAAELAVVAYFPSGDEGFSGLFCTRADRLRNVIVGPLSADRAFDEFGTDIVPPQLAHALELPMLPDDGSIPMGELSALSSSARDGYLLHLQQTYPGLTPHLAQKSETPAANVAGAPDEVIVLNVFGRILVDPLSRYGNGRFNGPDKLVSDIADLDLHLSDRDVRMISALNGFTINPQRLQTHEARAPKPEGGLSRAWCASPCVMAQRPTWLVTFDHAEFMSLPYTDADLARRAFEYHEGKGHACYLFELSPRAPKPSYQERVAHAITDAGGGQRFHTTSEHAHLYFEQSVKAARLFGCTEEEAHSLVDSVFRRSNDEVHQVVGSAAMHLAALCTAAGISLDEVADGVLESFVRTSKVLRANLSPEHSGTTPRY